MTWLALGVAIVAGWPRRGQALADGLVLAGSIVVGLLCLSTADPVAGARSVALILAMIGRCQPGLDGRAIVLVAGCGRARRISARLHGNPGRLVRC